MKIAQNTVVALTYQLKVEGKLADEAKLDKPLEFIQGTGMLLPKFESEIEGKEPGDHFEFTLTPEEGYGEINPEYVIKLPKSAFELEGKVCEDLLVVGNIIPMLNNDGQVIQGTVLEISTNDVTMDFNHPMAGKTLDFCGSIVSVREATDKELTEGLHGEYLPQEEGCGGHCCHGGHGEEGGCCHDNEEKEGCCCHEGKKKGSCCKSE